MKKCYASIAVTRYGKISLTIRRASSDSSLLFIISAIVSY